MKGEMEDDPTYSGWSKPYLPRHLFEALLRWVFLVWK
jgi:hypothetical protein